MIELEQAKETYFTQSTLEEILAYLKEVGVETEKLGPRSRSWDALRKRLMKTLGMVEYGAPALPMNNTVKMHSAVVPPYNMKPTGKWEGRRHRITLAKPENTRRETMRAFSVNGYVCEVKYGEPTPIPEPIWRLIESTQKAVPIPEVFKDGDVLERATTKFVLEDAYSYKYHGVDPETADRCGSIIEWYQAKGIEFFKTMSLQELRRVAQEIDIPWRDEEKKPLDKAELLDRVYIHVWSDAPATDIAA